MLDAYGKVLYVGKAKNLQARVSSYFNKQTDAKTCAMLECIADIDCIITSNEQEALLLEYSLIKKLKPKYNIIFKDDKSYPYIRLSKDKSPLLEISRKPKDTVFGPFPSVTDAKTVLLFLQKTFKLRNCSNQSFKNRTRPCLQYQIKRCTAPCVKYISNKDYLADVAKAKSFLEGNTSDLVKKLMLDMQVASDIKAYENAAKIRDQISSLQKLQQEQIANKANIDIIAIALEFNLACVYLLNVRGGKVIGGRPFYLDLKHSLHNEEIEVLTTFLEQYYTEHKLNPKPTELVVANKVPFTNVKVPTTGYKLQLLNLAKTNAKEALTHKLEEIGNYHNLFVELEERFKVSINKVACVDISHTQGTDTVAAVVVFTKEGKARNLYKKFNIRTAKASDDYQAITEAVARYLDGNELDLFIIDGGRGQLTAAIKGLKNELPLIAVAKGAGRKEGLETLYTKAGVLTLTKANFYLLLRIRNEAHRFALLTHKNKQKKRLTHSVLEQIPGIGPKTRQMLLAHFGGMQGLKQASIEELEKVIGIGKSMAKKIYAYLH